VAGDMPADRPVADRPPEPRPPEPMVEPVVEKKTFKLKIASDKPGLEFSLKTDDDPETELRTPFENNLVEGTRVLITPKSSDYAQQSLTIAKDEDVQLKSLTVTPTTPMTIPMTAPMDKPSDEMKPMSIGEDTIKIMF